MNILRNKNNFNIFYFSFIIGLLVSLYRVLPILFNDCVYQDDFGQSYFWVWRLWDPELFKNYYIADIYKSHLTRTPLVNLIFHTAPYLTSNLILFSKTLAIIIGSFTTFYAGLFFYDLTKNKTLSTVYTFFMANVFWFTDHVSNACTRCYLWIGIFAYLYYKNRDKNLICTLICFILLLSSPFTFLICLTMEFYNLILNINYKNINVSLKKNLTTIGSIIFNTLSVSVLYLIVFKNIKTQANENEIMFTLEELKKLPEFNHGGRHPIFGASLKDGSWFNDMHWGLPLGEFGIYHVIGIILFLALIFLFLSSKKQNLSTSLKKIFKNNITTLLYSSITLYILAQITYPLLYLPNRYIFIPWIILCTLVPFLILNDYSQTYTNKKVFILINVLGIVLYTGLLGYGLYRFHPQYESINPVLKSQIEVLPKDSVIAAYPDFKDLSKIPITTKRITFVDKERSIAYSKESLFEIRRRTIESFKITYASSLNEVISLMKENNISHFIASKEFYKKKYLKNPYYLRPYNKSLREIIKQKQEKGFYFDNLLSKRNKGWILVSLNELIKEDIKK